MQILHPRFESGCRLMGRGLSRLRLAQWCGVASPRVKCLQMAELRPMDAARRCYCQLAPRVPACCGGKTLLRGTGRGSPRAERGARGKRSMSVSHTAEPWVSRAHLIRIAPKGVEGFWGPKIGNKGLSRINQNKRCATFGLARGVYPCYSRPRVLPQNEYISAPRWEGRRKK